jgi:hypothetical protein
MNTVVGVVVFIFARRFSSTFFPVVSRLEKVGEGIDFCVLLAGFDGRLVSSGDS